MATGGILAPVNDFNVEAQNIARRRAITDALMQQSLQPIHNPTASGGLEVPISPLQGISQVLKAYFSAKSQKNLEGQEAGLAGRYRGAQQADLESLINGGADNTALLRAVGSQFPAVSGLATKLIEKREEKQIGPKDLLGAPGTSPESRKAAIQGGGVAALASPIETKMDNGNVIKVTPEGKVEKLGFFGQEFEKNPDGSTKIYQIPGADGKNEPYQRNAATGKLEKMDQAPKTTVSVDASNKQQGRAGFQLGEDDSKALRTATDLAQNAGRSIQTVHLLRGALDSEKAITGTGASVQTVFLRAADSLGVTGKTGEEKLAKTAQLVQGLAQLELDAAPQMKGQGQITNFERGILRRAASGDFGKSAAELQQTLDVIEGRSRKRIDFQAQELGKFKKAYPDVSTGMHEGIVAPPEYKGPMDKFKKGGEPSSSDPYGAYLRKGK